jgi:hypothetical protein
MKTYDLRVISRDLWCTDSHHPTVTHNNSARVHGLMRD